VLEILSTLSSGDTVLAALVTGLCKGTFRNASKAGEEAVETLKAKIDSDRSERSAAKQAEAAAARAEQEERVRRNREAARLEAAEAREGLRQRFLGLMQESDPQRRGYLLEIFINDLFAFEELNPRRSFKIAGEQIDGSMLWRERTNLVEV
jgi:hypothetical protein